MSTHTRRSVCSLDCPDSCGVLVTVDTESGRALKLQGDPAHPVTRGFLCAKVNKYLDRVYAPDRVLHPLRRKPGFPKGAGLEAFERSSWDEALDAIAAQLKRVADRHGPEAILPYSYAGTTGTLGYGSMDRRFFHRLGASRLDRTICAAAGGEALLSVYGAKLGTDTEQFHRARLILAWGANIHGNNPHLWPQVEQARRNGAKLVVIDPYRTRTAGLADLHLAPHPGTDTALALGLMHVILRDGLEDRAWTAAHTYGLPELRAHVLPYTPAEVERWTGIPAQTIEALAREYATTQPAAIRVNYGVQRQENGGAAVRAILMLPALTGAWAHLGGGAQLSTSGAYGLDKAALERPDLQPHGPARLVNMTLLGEALADGTVHALFVYNSNPAVIAPDQGRVLAGLARPELFTVVHEQAFTDTCRYADYVLPATTFLETPDLQAAYGHYHVQLSEQAIAPVGEARSNVSLFAALAGRMGFTEPCFRDDPETLIAQALHEGGAQPASLQGITRATLRAHGGSERLRIPVQPFAAGPFPTPSGKVEFYAASQPDPLPTFRPPAESRAHAPAGMLELLPRKGTHFMNSTFTDQPTHRKLQTAGDALELHPEDAAARGIADGQTVRVRNARGTLTLTAAFSDRVRPGVAAAVLDRGGAGVNLLTSQRLTDLGNGPTFYSTLVYVEPLTSGTPGPPLPPSRG